MEVTCGDWTVVGWPEGESGKTTVMEWTLEGSVDWAWPTEAENAA